MEEQAISDVQRVPAQQRKKSSSFLGMGVAFLPSDINKLVKKHKLLFRALNSGNTGLIN